MCGARSVPLGNLAGSSYREREGRGGGTEGREGEGEREVRIK